MTRPDWADPLGSFVAAAAEADHVRIEAGDRLVGGAIQVNQAVTAVIEGGPEAGTHELVLRMEAVAAVSDSLPLWQQFALLEAAAAAGVTVPQPMWCCDDPSVIGRPFYLMRRVFGMVLGPRIVRSGPHPALAAALAAELARIHTIVPPRADLEFLDMPRESPALDSVAKYRAYLDAEPAPHPAIEWGLRWLERNAPEMGEIVLAHHDFRTGNYMVDDGRIIGILDWEFAGWSDPIEDVAWFCAKCWRSGGFDQEAGGIAPRAVFYDAYESASGRAIDRDAVGYWEAMAHVRWAVIALQQAGRHISGAEPNLDLALVGRRLAELEYEILVLTGVM